MPETSQDHYEALHPGKQPVSVEELRKRSNSLVQNKLTPTITVADPVAIESNFLWPTAEPRRKRESRVSISDYDSCITAPDLIKGYKRESSHRWEFTRNIEKNPFLFSIVRTFHRSRIRHLQTCRVCVPLIALWAHIVIIYLLMNRIVIMMNGEGHYHT